MAGGARAKGKSPGSKAKGKGKGGRGGREDTEPEEEEEGDADEDGAEGTGSPVFKLEPYRAKMTDALEQLHRDLGGVRTSAHPRLLDAIHVESPKFGTKVPLRSLATVVVRSPQLLVVEMYDKEDADTVVKAIQKSPLQLNARVEGGEVLVPVPKMTMDVVEKMTRLAKDEGEAAKVEVRRLRHDALAAFRKGPGAKHLSRDEIKRTEQQIQALTDEFTAKADEMTKAKIEDLRKNH